MSRQSSASGAGDRAPPFEELLVRHANGDQEAARILYERYNNALRHSIRHNLKRSPALCRLFDADDFEQSTWETVLEEIKEGKWFASERDFKGFISVVAHNYVRMARRAHITAEKRSLTRDVHFELALHDRCAAEPAATAEAQSADDFAGKLAKLPQLLQKIVSGLRAGESLPDIAARRGLSLRHIQRLVKTERDNAGEGAEA